MWGQILGGKYLFAAIDIRYFWYIDIFEMQTNTHGTNQWKTSEISDKDWFFMGETLSICNYQTVPVAGKLDFELWVCKVKIWCHDQCWDSPIAQVLVKGKQKHGFLIGRKKDGVIDGIRKITGLDVCTAQLLAMFRIEMVGCHHKQDHNGSAMTHRTMAMMIDYCSNFYSYIPQYLNKEMEQWKKEAKIVKQQQQLIK